MIEQDVLFNFLHVSVNFAKPFSFFSCKFLSITYLSRIEALLLTFNFSQGNIFTHYVWWESFQISKKIFNTHQCYSVVYYPSINFWIEIGS